MKSQNVGIIGSGIAGSSLAIFLSRAGIKITILERQENPSPVGSGIMLQPPAVKTLELLGVRDQIVNNGCSIKGFHGINKKGKQVLDFEFGKVDKNLFGLGVHRGSIFMNLKQKAEEGENVTIIYGTEVVSINDMKDCVEVNDSQANKYTFDILIVANGSGSLLRNQFPEIVTRAEKQKYAALWTTLPLGNNKDFHDRISHSYHKSEHMYGLMPIGYATNNHRESSAQINFFCAVSSDFVKDWDETQFKKWKEDSYKLAPKYGEFIDQVESFEQLTATQYFDAKLKPFHRGRVAFIGDACHALSPHLSAGSNLALMDSLVLSDAIINRNTHQEAFKEYFELRKSQVYYYYFISRLITPMFQSKINLSWIRDNVIPLLYKVPLTRNLMVETIAGVKKGLFSKLDQKYYV